MSRNQINQSINQNQIKLHCKFQKKTKNKKQKQNVATEKERNKIKQITKNGATKIKKKAK